MTNSAVARAGLECERMVREAERKTRPSRVIRLVLPGVGVDENSQDRMAKKNPPMTRSAVMEAAVLQSSGLPAPTVVYRCRSSLGVTACCRLGTGSELSKAQRRARMVGRKLVLFGLCRGLGCRCFQNDKVKRLAASRRVLATTGCGRFPISSPATLH